MGLSGIGWGELLVVLAIVVLVFGTGKLGQIGGDLGAAIRSFRSAMSDADRPPVQGAPAAGATPQARAPEAAAGSSPPGQGQDYAT